LTEISKFISDPTGHGHEDTTDIKLISAVYGDALTEKYSSMKQ
jgi:hypothetical protein